MSTPDITRSAKSGDDWTPNDLTSYRIEIRAQEPAQFYGQQMESINNGDLDPNLFLNIDQPLPHGKLARQTSYLLRFLQYMQDPNTDGDRQTFIIRVLAKTTLELMGYEGIGTMIAQRFPITLIVCGERRTNTTDVNVLSPQCLMLLVGRVARMGGNVQAQVISDAIAALQHSNSLRTKLGLQPLDLMNIPCITMVGTRPAFYKVPVTRALSDAVVLGQLPVDPTIVTYCTPQAPYSNDDQVVGMEDVAYRRTSLEYFSAFREVAKQCWAPITAGV